MKIKPGEWLSMKPFDRYMAILKTADSNKRG